MVGAEEAALLRFGIGRDRRGSASSARRPDRSSSLRSRRCPTAIMSCAAPCGRSASRFTPPTMCDSGQIGCSAKYSEPSSPCSSSVQKMNAMERCGLGLVMRRRPRPVPERSTSPMPLSIGAVVDLVGPGDVGLDAEMIPMRAVDHDIARMLVARDDADDIARVEMRDVRIRRRHRASRPLIATALKPRLLAAAFRCS